MWTIRAEECQAEELAEWLHVDEMLSELPMPEADYNIAPRLTNPLFARTARRVIARRVLARLGLCHSLQRISAGDTAESGELLR